MPKERGGDEELVKTIPLRRVGEHIELANLAAFLVSDGAAYINGDAVVIDGGKMQSGGGGANTARSRCSTGPTSNRRRCGRRRSEYRDVRALLTSNCASDRLRRLSVDADECPPHVFGVTEADRVRDAFDRFGSRLYAASGQIGAEPFHHTRGRGARLRPECAAELAQAHADLLRQTLDGEPFGDVIASIANGRGNPVILWREIDGSGELRLSAMAAMVDNEVLCHAFGDGKTMVLLDQSQREINPGRDAS